MAQVSEVIALTIFIVLYCRTRLQQCWAHSSWNLTDWGVELFSVMSPISNRVMMTNEDESGYVQDCLPSHNPDHHE
ncbi:hypothetical protein TNCV_888351 [Trichonephila clavipes]|nr:hypothetical protein TNCV_888351 [Trichonephila clavipes]